MSWSINNVQVPLLLLLCPLSSVYFICLPICLYAFCFKTFKRVSAILTCECFVLPSLLVIIIIIIIQSRVKSFGSWLEFWIQSHLLAPSLLLVLLNLGFNLVLLLLSLNYFTYLCQSTGLFLISCQS